MNKDAALKHLAQLEAEAKALREILEAPPAPAIAPLPLPSFPGEKSWRLDGSNGGFSPTNFTGLPCGNNFYPDRATAQAYADAFDVALALRRQPGSDGKPFGPGHIVRIDKDGDLVILRYSHCDANSRITPVFTTRSFADAAIEAVGKDRVIAAIKLFSNFN